MTTNNHEDFRESILSILERNHTGLQNEPVEEAASASSGKTVSERYEKLDAQIKSLYNSLLDYASSKPNAVAKLAKSNENVKCGSEFLLKLEIRTNGTIVAKIALVDEQLRLSALYNPNIKRVKAKPIEVKIKTADDARTAMTLVDMAYDRIGEVKQAVKEERKMIRKNRVK